MEDNTYAIYHDLTIKASKKEVYDAITVPMHLNNWWPSKSSGTPEMGAIYNFNFTSDYDWYGKVVKCEKDQIFYIKMTESDENWNATTFGFEIEDSKDGVRIKFKHINWPTCNAEFRQSSFCWAMLLNGLKNYIEKGEIIPFNERE